MYSLIARSIGCKEEQLMMGLTVSRYLQVEGSCSEMLRDIPSTHLWSAAVQTYNTQPVLATHQISGTTWHLYTLHTYVQQVHSVVMQKCSCHKDMYRRINCEQIVAELINNWLQDVSSRGPLSAAYKTVLYAADEGPRAETSCNQLLINSARFAHNQFAFTLKTVARSLYNYHKDISLHSQLHISVFACYITLVTFCIIVHNYPTEKGNTDDIYNNVHNFTTT